MGSYDTGEVEVAPRTREHRPEPRAPEPRETAPYVPRSTSTRSSGPTGDSPTNNYDPGLKTIAALGGGLTPDRIVQPIPETVRDGSLREVVKYLTGDDVASRPEDKAIAEAVRARMGQNNYRIIVNGVQNVSSSRIEDRVAPYFTLKEQRGEDGPIKYNFVDLAIVSHDEGGRAYSTLDRLL